MKKVLFCTVVNNKGIEFPNPLKLSEAHLISQIAQENESIKVECIEVTKQHYKTLFG